MRPPLCYSLFPYTTLFRSRGGVGVGGQVVVADRVGELVGRHRDRNPGGRVVVRGEGRGVGLDHRGRSEEHTSELQSRLHFVCRLLLEKKKASQGRSQTFKT